MSKLYEVIAQEKGVKQRTYSGLTELDKKAQKAEPYNGFSKKFEKKDEDGEDFPPESKPVTLRAVDVLAQIRKLNTEAFDIEATKDSTNRGAVADLVVEGEVLIKQAPVALLLYLDKQLTDVRTMIDRMPVLDETEEWQLDSATGLFKTAPARSHRMKKTQRAIVLYDATEHHPAQTQLITEDVIVGWWTTTKMSSALPAHRKDQIIERCDKLLKAVKAARERANDIVADEQEVGDAIFNFLFR